MTNLTQTDPNVSGPTKDDRHVPLRDACAYADVSLTTLYRWRDRGLITFHKAPRGGGGPKPAVTVSLNEIDAAINGVPVVVSSARESDDGPQADEPEGHV